MKRKILVDGKLIEASISTEYKCRLKNNNKKRRENENEKEKRKRRKCGRNFLFSYHSTWTVEVSIVKR